MTQEASLPPAASRSTIDWRDVRKVLLVRLRSIGDTVLMTACLEALHDFQPSLEIGVLVEPLAAPVLSGHALIDRLFIAEKSIPSRAALISELRREGFDVAFNLHGGTTGMMLTAMSGATHTVGYRDQRGSRLLNARAPAPNVILNRDRIHSVEQQLALLNWTGVPMPERPRLSLSIEDHAAASARAKLLDAGLAESSLAAGRFAVVAPDAAFESKRWSAEGFASVIDHLNSRWQIESIVIARPGATQLAEQVARASHSTTYLLTEVDLHELKAMIGNFGRIFVGNDSGPMHIAAALDCPIVGVFGSSNPEVWRPWTAAPYRTVGGEQGSADSNVRSRIDTVGITEVIAAVDEVLQSAAAETAC